MEGKGFESKYNYEKEETIPKNEIRIKSERGLTGYLRYAYTCLEKDGMDSIVIKGVGNAMNRVVDLAELIKRRIKGLYSDTEMESQVDKFDESRTILSLKVTLSKKKLNEKSPGFQVPIDESLVTPYVEEPEHAEHKEDQVYEKHEDDGEHRGRGYGRGYRGFRGSRGGYGRPYRGTRGTRGSRGSEFYSSRGDQGHRGGYGYRGSRGDHPRGSRGDTGYRGSRGSRGSRGGRGSWEKSDFNKKESSGWND